MKVCSVCKDNKSNLDYYKSKYSKDGYKAACKECSKLKTKQYKQTTKYKEWEKEYSKSFKVKEYQKVYNQTLKLKVLQHYAGSLIPFCSCCGTTVLSFLTLDHIHGKGTQERKKVTNSYYKYIVDNNYPEYLQVLCMNCNFAKRTSNECPAHKTLECLFDKGKEIGKRFTF